MGAQPRFGSMQLTQPYLTLADHVSRLPRKWCKALSVAICPNTSPWQGTQAQTQQPMGSVMPMTRFGGPAVRP